MLLLAPFGRSAAKNAKFHPFLHEGVDVRMDVLRTDAFLRTNISWMHRLPIFLPMVLRCARFARESSAKNFHTELGVPVVLLCDFASSRYINKTALQPFT